MSVGYRHCHGLMAAVILSGPNSSVGCHCRDHVQPRRTAQENRSRAKGPANPRALRRNFWVADGHVPNAKQDGNHCVPALPLWRWWLAWHIRHANRTVLRVLRTPELGNSNFANVLRLHGFAYGDFFIFPLQWVNSVWLEDFFYCSWWSKSKASVASLCWYGTMVALIIVESLSSTFVDLSSLSCHCHLFRL